MPFLRFSRDKRGYENTYVMHSYRRRGRSRTRLLYWFRTPPNIRVGRSPLDEDAIRALEEGNPDLIFDWEKILERRTSRSRPQGGADSRATPVAEAPGEDPRDLAEAAELGTGDDETPAPMPPARAAMTAIDGETLARLRTRYSELMARISDRIRDPARQEQLRGEAERLNPDTWVTNEEVQAALAGFEAAFDILRGKLGSRRRRRRGRRSIQPLDTAIATVESGESSRPHKKRVPDEPEGRPAEMNGSTESQAKSPGSPYNKNGDS